MSESIAPGPLIAERVKHFRERQGWSQRQLAERLEVLGYPINRVTLAKIEGGGTRARNVSVEEMLALAAALSVPPLMLLVPLDGRRLLATPSTPMGSVLALNWIEGREPFAIDRGEGAIANADLATWKATGAPLQNAARLRSALEVIRTTEAYLANHEDEDEQATAVLTEQLQEARGRYKALAEVLGEEVSDEPAALSAAKTEGIR